MPYDYYSCPYEFHARGYGVDWFSLLKRHGEDMTRLEAEIAGVLLNVDLATDDKVNGIVKLVSRLVAEATNDERARVCREIKHTHGSAELADALWDGRKIADAD